MSHKNYFCSSEQPTAQKSDQIANKLNVYGAASGPEKLDMIDQLIKHIKSLEQQNKLLKNLSQQDRKSLEMRLNKEKIQGLKSESIKNLKQTYEKRINQLNQKIKELKTQCDNQQIMIKKYLQNEKQYVKNDQFFEYSKKQLQAQINLRKAIAEKKILQDKYEALKKQSQNKNDQQLQSFCSKVNKLKQDYDNLLQENRKIHQKHDIAQKQLERQKSLLKKENSKLKNQHSQFQQKLKSSNRFTSRLIKFIAEKGQKQTSFQIKVSSIKVSQLENNIQSEKNEYQNQIANTFSSLYDRNRVNKTQKQNLERQLKKLSGRVQSLQNDLKSSKDELGITSQELRSTKGELGQKITTLVKKQNQIQNLLKELQVKQTQLTAANKKCTQLGQQLKLQKQTCKKEIELKQSALKDSQIKSVQIKELKSNNQELKIQVSNLNNQIDSKNVQIVGLKSLVSTHQNTIIALNKQIDDLNKKILVFQGQVQALVLRGKQLDKVIQQLKTKNAVLQGKRTQLKQKLQICQGNYNTLNIQHKNIKNRQRQLQLGFKQVCSIYNKCLIEPITYAFLNKAMKVDEPRPERVGEIERDLQQIGQNLRYTLRASKYFNNSRVLNEVQVDFLIDTVESYTKRNVQSTFLVYKYDTINPVNFHNYIDKKQNLILVVKLANGYVIGGFTEYAIDKGRIEKPGSGFIFNCNIKKSYNVKSDARLPVVSYDDYFCLFGNAEIRLKSQEAKMFSNFGIAASTFETGRQQRTKFLNIENSNDNQLDLETYEFYQITFKR